MSLSSQFLNILNSEIMIHFRKVGIYSEIFILKNGLMEDVLLSTHLISQRLNLPERYIQYVSRLINQKVIPIIAGERKYLEFREECSKFLLLINGMCPSSIRDISIKLDIQPTEVVFIVRLSELIGLTPNLFTDKMGITCSASDKSIALKRYIFIAKKLSFLGYFTLTQFVNEASKPKYDLVINESICRDVLPKFCVKLDGCTEDHYFMSNVENKILDVIYTKIGIFGYCNRSILNEFKVPEKLSSSFIYGSGLCFDGDLIRSNTELENSNKFKGVLKEMISIWANLSGGAPVKLSLPLFYDACEQAGLRRATVKFILYKNTIIKCERLLCWIDP